VVAAVFRGVRFEEVEIVRTADEKIEQTRKLTSFCQQFPGCRNLRENQGSGAGLFVNEIECGRGVCRCVGRNAVVQRRESLRIRSSGWSSAEGDTHRIRPGAGWTDCGRSLPIAQRTRTATRRSSIPIIIDAGQFLPIDSPGWLGTSAVSENLTVGKHTLSVDDFEDLAVKELKYLDNLKVLEMLLGAPETFEEAVSKPAAVAVGSVRQTTSPTPESGQSPPRRRSYFRGRDTHRPLFAPESGDDAGPGIRASAEPDTSEAWARRLLQQDMPPFSNLTDHSFWQ